LLAALRELVVLLLELLHLGAELPRPAVALPVA
jgi:hypothetical protein